MFEAIQLVVEFGFKQLNIHSIEAVVNPENNASIKILEKTDLLGKLIMLKIIILKESSSIQLFILYLKKLHTKIMVSAAACSKIILALADVTSAPHFDRIAFKTNKRIFATMAADGLSLNVKLTKVDQSVFVPLMILLYSLSRINGVYRVGLL